MSRNYIHVHKPLYTCTWEVIACTHLLFRMNSQDYSPYTLPHPLKNNGRPVVITPLLLYTDDTSGNKSKKWNKFDCWCFLLAGLSRKINAQLNNIHFISCSNRVNVMDMMVPIVTELKMLEQGVPVFDAYLQKEVLLVAPVLAFLCDNPRHSELLNHFGGNAKKYCRMCMVCLYMCTVHT